MSRPRPRFVLPMFAVLTAAGVAWAQAPDRNVVAKVGDASISLDEARARLRQVPVFQLRTLGETPDDIRRVFIQELVSMELIVLGARHEGIADRPDVREKIMVRLKDAVVENVLQELRNESISDEAVKAYYEQNRQQYTAQTRLKLWRIVVKTRVDAQAILDFIKTDAEYQKDPVAGWEKLANERSIDRTTAMRRGDLGFVQPNGMTAQQDQRVNPALFQAALKVKDGEVVPEPLEDEGHWVVLQRRGSHVTPERSLASEAATIRDILGKRRVRERMDALLGELRKKHVGEINVQLLEQLDITRDGELAPRSRPGTLPRKSHPAAASPRPQGLPGNLR